MLSNDTLFAFSKLGNNLLSCEPLLSFMPRSHLARIIKTRANSFILMFNQISCVSKVVILLQKCVNVFSPPTFGN